MGMLESLLNQWFEQTKVQDTSESCYGLIYVRVDRIRKAPRGSLISIIILQSKSQFLNSLNFGQRRKTGTEEHAHSGAPTLPSSRRSKLKTCKLPAPNSDVKRLPRPLTFTTTQRNRLRAFFSSFLTVVRIRRTQVSPDPCLDSLRVTLRTQLMTSVRTIFTSGGAGRLALEGHRAGFKMTTLFGVNSPLVPTYFLEGHLGCLLSTEPRQLETPVHLSYIHSSSSSSSSSCFGLRFAWRWSPLVRQGLVTTLWLSHDALLPLTSGMVLVRVCVVGSHSLHLTLRL